MSEHEKSVAESITRALEALPDHKKEFLAGYAEGVNVMASAQPDKPYEQAQDL